MEAPVIDMEKIKEACEAYAQQNGELVVALEQVGRQPTPWFETKVAVQTLIDFLFDGDEEAGAIFQLNMLRNANALLQHAVATAPPKSDLVVARADTSEVERKLIVPGQ